MSSRDSRMLVSTLSTSSSEEEEESPPRPPDPEPNLPSELLPERDSRSEELRMLPPSPLTPPERREVEEEEDSEHISVC